MKLFLSFTSQDRNHPIFNRLLADLKSRELDLWMGEEKIRSGDNIFEKIKKGIDSTDYFLYVLSKNGTENYWMSNEYNLAYVSQLSRQTLQIIPIIIDQFRLPPFIRDSQNINLASDYEAGIKTLFDRLLLNKDDLIAQFEIDKSIKRSSIIQVSSKIWEELIKELSRKPERLKKLDRRKFEELVAHLFDKFGYSVELTQKTRDGGRDVIAVKSKEVNVKYLIECKRPDPGGYVGIRPVRELYGVKTDEKATKAILATTAYFSKDALLFFDNHKWELEPRDYHGLLEWLNNYLIIK